jgi:hypothetical protein
MSLDQRFPLTSGRACTLRPRPLPGLPTYHVLFFASEQGAPAPDEEREMFMLAQVAATRLALDHCGDAGCYVILFSGSRTRRRPWPHFHIVAVRDVAAKRRALALLHIKRVLIWLQRVAAWVSLARKLHHV